MTLLEKLERALPAAREFCTMKDGSIRDRYAYFEPLTFVELETIVKALQK